MEKLDDATRAVAVSEEQTRKSRTVIRFVVTSDVAADHMKAAYNAMQELSFSVTWFASKDCIELKKNNKKTVYVFDEFSGPAFDHMLAIGCRIYGPSCILYCLERDERLPLVDRPVYSLSLKGSIVCCTNLLPNIRDELHNRVEYMCGEIRRDYVEEVTHLIAGEAGSRKYAVAAALKRRIMLPDWINAVWQDCRTGSIALADDPRYDQYKCPMFRGFVMSVSGLETEERNRIKNVIEENGGKYSGEMKFKECTHLIITAPRGQKYTFARKWHINVITPDWVLDSVKAGYSLSEINYLVKEEAEANNGGGASTSTPASSRAEGISSLSVSSISMTHVDDTTMGRFAGNSMLLGQDTALNFSSLSNISLDMAAATAGDATSELDSLNLKDCKNDHYLDNCRIYVDGLTGGRLEKVKRIINLGGATRLNELMESVTHIVLCGMNDQLVKQLKEAAFRPKVVSLRWLIECFKLGSLVPEVAFIAADLDLPALDSANSVRSDQAVEALVVPKPRVQSTDKTPTTVSRRDGNDKPDDDDDMNNILSQYLPNFNATGSMGESTMLQAVHDYSNRKLNASAANASLNKTTASDNDVTIDLVENAEYNDDDTQDIVGENFEPDETHNAAPEGGLFERKTFVMADLPADNAEALAAGVCQLGGTVLPLSSRKIADYAVVSVFGSTVAISAVTVVTNIWLQHCLEEQKLLDIDSDILYTPLSIKPNATPLSGCVLSISGYAGIEREILVHLSSLLGSVCQDFFVKKAKDSLLASTHLIVNAPQGSKFDAAKRWNLPAVSCSWLYECARTGTRLQENLFFVDQLSDTTSNSVSSSKNLNKNSTGEIYGISTSSLKNFNNNTSDENDSKSTSSLNNMDKSTYGGPTVKDQVELRQSDPNHGPSDLFKKPLVPQQSLNSIERNQRRKTTEGGQTFEGDTTSKIVEKGFASEVYTTCSNGTGGGDISAHDAKQSTPSYPSLEIEDTGRKEISRKSSGRLGSGANASGLDLSVFEDGPGKEKSLVKSRKSSGRLVSGANVSENDSSVFEDGPGISVVDLDLDNDDELKENVEQMIKQALSNGGTPVNKQNIAAVKDALTQLQKSGEGSCTPINTRRLSTSRDHSVLTIPKQLDLTEVLRLLATPELSPRAKQRRQLEEQNRSPSIEEFFSKQLALAVQSLQENTTNDKQRRINQSLGSQDNSDQHNMYHENNAAEETVKPLRGVIIVVSKKLSKNQSDYNTLAASLGAEYYWMYDDSCTHYIFQGRQNDTNKEFRMARRDGKCIVSPHWLTACAEQNQRLDETMYPHTFNPDMSLTILSQKTPGRQLTRSCHRKTPAAVSSAELGSTPLGYQVAAAELGNSSPSAALGSTAAAAKSGSSSDGLPANSGDTSHGLTAVAADLGFTSNSLPAAAANAIPIEAVSSSSVQALGDVRKSDTEVGKDWEGNGGVPQSGVVQKADNVDELMNGLRRINEEASSRRRNITRSSSFQTPPSGSTSANNSTTSKTDLAPRLLAQKSVAVTTTSDSHTQASQVVEVTWDDPAARAQWEMLAPDLAQNSEQISPYRKLQSPLPNLSENSRAGSGVVNQTKPNQSESSKAEARTTKSSANIKPDNSAKEVDKVKSADSVVPEKPPCRVFLFSGIPTAEKDRLAQVVERLGGLTIDTSEYSSEATHLIVNMPIRNEKYLACVAAGAWVLHKSYLEASDRQNAFLSESDHEWGGPGTAALLLTLPDQTVKLAAAAFRWHRKLSAGLSDGKQASQNSGAFQTWKVVLYTDVKREANFRRLLEAGGATVVPNGEHVEDLQSLTHAFMELSKTKQQINVELFAKAGVHCVRPDYIAAYLMDDPAPAPTSYYIPEVIPYVSKNPGSGSSEKNPPSCNTVRRNSNNTNNNNNNNRDVAEKSEAVNNNPGSSGNEATDAASTATTSSRKRRMVADSAVESSAKKKSR